MHVSAPAIIYSVPVSAPTRVHSLPAAIPQRPEASGARFSTLGFLKDKANVEVDIRNQEVRLIAALGKSANLLLVNTHYPQQFLVPAAT